MQLMQILQQLLANKLNPGTGTQASPMPVLMPGADAGAATTAGVPPSGTPPPTPATAPAPIPTPTAGPGPHPAMASPHVWSFGGQSPRADKIHNPGGLVNGPYTPATGMKLGDLKSQRGANSMFRGKPGSTIGQFGMGIRPTQ